MVRLRLLGLKFLTAVLAALVLFSLMKLFTVVRRRAASPIPPWKRRDFPDRSGGRKSGRLPKPRPDPTSAPSTFPPPQGHLHNQPEPLSTSSLSPQSQSSSQPASYLRRMLFIHLTPDELPEALPPLTALCVSAAAQLHPLWAVAVLTNSQDLSWPPTLGPPPPNVRLRRVALTDVLLKHERLRTWWAGYEQYSQKSENLVYLSDALRLAVVGEEGGVYVDSDLLLLRPFHWASLGDSAFQLKEGALANGLLPFRPGHPLIRVALSKWRVWTRVLCNWNCNGPWLMDRAAQELIGAENLTLAQSGPKLRILPSSHFYQIDWTRRSEFLEPHRLSQHIAELRLAKATGVHLWRSSLLSNATHHHLVRQPTPSALLEHLRGLFEAFQPTLRLPSIPDPGTTTQPTAIESTKSITLSNSDVVRQAGRLLPLTPSSVHVPL